MVPIRRPVPKILTPPVTLGGLLSKAAKILRLLSYFCLGPLSNNGRNSGLEVKILQFIFKISYSLSFCWPRHLTYLSHSLICFYIRILTLRLSTSYACYNDQVELDKMTLQKSLKKNICEILTSLSLTHWLTFLGFGFLPHPQPSVQQ